MMDANYIIPILALLPIAFLILYKQEFGNFSFNPRIFAVLFIILMLSPVGFGSILPQASAAVDNEIRQIIKISETYPAGVASADFAFAPPLLNIDKAIIFYTVSHTSENDHSDTFKSVEILDESTIRLKGEDTASGNNAIDFFVYIVEFNPEAKLDVQHLQGTINSGGTGTEEFAMGSVNTTNSMIVSRGHHHNASDTGIGSEEFTRIRILNSTAWEYFVSDSIDTGPQGTGVSIIDWNQTNIRTVRDTGVMPDVTGDQIFTVVPPSSVDPTRSILMVTYASDEGLSVDNDDLMIAAALTDSGNIVLQRVDAEGNLNFAYEIVEFPANFLKVKHFNSTILDTSLTLDVTVPTIKDFDKTMAMSTVGSPFGFSTGQGNNCCELPGAIDRSQATFFVTDNTNVQLSRDDSSGDMAISWQLIEFIEPEFAEAAHGTNFLEQVVKIQGVFPSGDAFKDFTITPALTTVNKTMIFMTMNSTFQSGSSENGKMWGILNETTFRIIGSSDAVNDEAQFNAVFVEMNATSPIFIQHDQLQFTGGTTDPQKNMTISPVNTTTTFIIGQGSIMEDSDPTFGMEEFATVTLENETTWKYEPQVAQDSTATAFRAEIVDFNDNGVLVQRGTGTFSGLTDTITPPIAIDREQSLLFMNFRTVSGAFGETPDRSSFLATIDTNNDIFIQRNSSAISLDYAWQTISFLADQARVQHGTHQQLPGESNMTEFIPPFGTQVINASKAFAIGTVGGYYTQSMGSCSSSVSNNYDCAFGYMELVNGSTLRLIRGDATGEWNMGFQVTEFLFGSDSIATIKEIDDAGVNMTDSVSFVVSGNATEIVNDTGVNVTDNVTTSLITFDTVNDGGVNQTDTNTFDFNAVLTDDTSGGGGGGGTTLGVGTVTVGASSPTEYQLVLGAGEMIDQSGGMNFLTGLGDDDVVAGNLINLTNAKITKLTLGNAGGPFGDIAINGTTNATMQGFVWSNATVDSSKLSDLVVEASTDILGLNDFIFPQVPINDQGWDNLLEMSPDIYPISLNITTPVTVTGNDILVGFLFKDIGQNLTSMSMKQNTLDGTPNLRTPNIQAACIGNGTTFTDVLSDNCISSGIIEVEHFLFSIAAEKDVSDLTVDTPIAPSKLRGYWTFDDGHVDDQIAMNAGTLGHDADAVMINMTLIANATLSRNSTGLIGASYLHNNCGGNGTNCQFNGTFNSGDFLQVGVFDQEDPKDWSFLHQIGATQNKTATSFWMRIPIDEAEPNGGSFTAISTSAVGVNEDGIEYNFGGNNAEVSITIKSNATTQLNFSFDGLEPPAPNQFVFPGSNNTDGGGSPPWWDGEWHHVVYNVDKGNQTFPATICLDGTATVGGECKSVPFDQAPSLGLKDPRYTLMFATLFGLGSANEEILTFELDEIAIWEDYQLTDSEIDQIATMAVVTTGGGPTAIGTITTGGSNTTNQVLYNSNNLPIDTSISVGSELDAVNGRIGQLVDLTSEKITGFSLRNMDTGGNQFGNVTGKIWSNVTVGPTSMVLFDTTSETTTTQIDFETYEKQGQLIDITDTQIESLTIKNVTTAFINNGTLRAIIYSGVGNNTLVNQTTLEATSDSIDLSTAPYTLNAAGFSVQFNFTGAPSLTGSDIFVGIQVNGQNDVIFVDVTENEIGGSEGVAFAEDTSPPNERWHNLNGTGQLFGINEAGTATADILMKVTTVGGGTVEADLVVEDTAETINFADGTVLTIEGNPINVPIFGNELLDLHFNFTTPPTLTGTFVIGIEWDSVNGSSGALNMVVTEERFKTSDEFCVFMNNTETLQRCDSTPFVVDGEDLMIEIRTERTVSDKTVTTSIEPDKLVGYWTFDTAETDDALFLNAGKFGHDADATFLAGFGNATARFNSTSIFNQAALRDLTDTGDPATRVGESIQVGTEIHKDNWQFLHSGNTTDTWSFSGWVRVNATDLTISLPIFATVKDHQNSGENGFVLEYDPAGDGTLHVRAFTTIGGGSDWIDDVSLDQVPIDNNFHHIALMVEKSNVTSTVKICIDGSTNCTLLDKTAIPTEGPSEMPLTFGSIFEFGEVDERQLQMDDFAFWEGHILTNAQIDLINGTGVGAPVTVGGGGMQVSDSVSTLLVVAPLNETINDPGVNVTDNVVIAINATVNDGGVNVTDNVVIAINATVNDGGVNVTDSAIAVIDTFCEICLEIDGPILEPLPPVPPELRIFHQLIEWFNPTSSTQDAVVIDIDGGAKFFEAILRMHNSTYGVSANMTAAAEFYEDRYLFHNNTDFFIANLTNDVRTNFGAEPIP